MLLRFSKGFRKLIPLLFISWKVQQGKKLIFGVQTLNYDLLIISLYLKQSGVLKKLDLLTLKLLVNSDTRKK